MMRSSREVSRGEASRTHITQKRELIKQPPTRPLASLAVSRVHRATTVSKALLRRTKTKATNGTNTPGHLDEYARVSEAAEYIEKASKGRKPQVAVVCGSGLGALVDLAEDVWEVDYSQIPHFPEVTVKGHAGSLAIGRIHGVDVLFMRGRFHLYEGYSAEQVVRPIRVMWKLGVPRVVLTTAAGSLRNTLGVGSVMCIEDHISLASLAGSDVLVGPNDERFGPRFPDMGETYDSALAAIASSAFEQTGAGPLPSGVFASVGGPSFETPAEVRLLQTVGADAVSMSTVPEATAAVHCGLRVLGLCVISNVCVNRTPFQMDRDGINPDLGDSANHASVVSNVNETVPKLQKFLKRFMELLVEEDGAVVASSATTAGAAEK